jgi:hypothetical protein
MAVISSVTGISFNWKCVTVSQIPIPSKVEDDDVVNDDFSGNSSDSSCSTLPQNLAISSIVVSVFAIVISSIAIYYKCFSFTIDKKNSIRGDVSMDFKANPLQESLNV